ncbi:thioredoxin family protein [Halobacillus yeomjeoni]|uniref:Thioredoxin family protein n=1 Tax=Halobacillus yeomjeoni TaxID=311194 RepID=A0A931MVU7_9BACI|nr:thioredoxin family protein [Halobacillus yeomjeoni]MBH0231012.1 thioredoxin family protein [Halobacillus yeomjeoni]
MQELDHHNAGKQIQERPDGYIFVHSPFCATCHLARKMLDTIEVTYGRELFHEFNASLHPELMEEYKIESVPCLLVTKYGSVIEKIYAFHSVPFMYEKIAEYVIK